MQLMRVARYLPVGASQGCRGTAGSVYDLSILGVNGDAFLCLR
jgi:hypothetical protein